ncbi:GNAT family N-acetyltransferase [Periweissella cryptocerci]|uniref:GNAT family N-acetyltransferase n=1 Tax=Periweissella cryptocerci TaxID=2506420 RepID=A0A4P6YSE6_9LACO|nr:GNAT family N-acetyltransferase [Periweissella cryptocerci]QBO35624.1 GNAT family N-acetyltransferase [Periweissella cryptocerci]
MTAEVNIRPAVGTDASGLLALLATLATESDTFTVSEASRHVTAEQEAQQIDALHQTTANIIFVAEFAGQLVGLATATELHDQHGTSEVGVAVLGAFQGNGIAQALVDEIIYWAETFSTLDKLFLSVQERNPAAIHIYEKLGFTPIPDSTKSVADMDGEVIPAFDMQYTLAPLVG